MDQIQSRDFDHSFVVYILAGDLIASQTFRSFEPIFTGANPLKNEVKSDVIYASSHSELLSVSGFAQRLRTEPGTHESRR